MFKVSVKLHYFFGDNDQQWVIPRGLRGACVARKCDLAAPTRGIGKYLCLLVERVMFVEENGNPLYLIGDVHTVVRLQSDPGPLLFGFICGGGVSYNATRTFTDEQWAIATRNLSMWEFTQLHSIR